MIQEKTPGWRSLALKLVHSMLFIAILNACSDDKISPNSNSTDTFSNQELVVLGKTLATALENQDVQKLLKEESLLQFDKDYDILVQMILDRQVNEDKTFIQLLNEISKGDIRGSLAKFPLLTIFVPHLKEFSAESWDVKNGDPPKVAIDILRDKSNMLPVIDAQGNIKLVSAKEQPSYPVIVLKENERVGVKGKSKISSAGRSIVYGNGEYTFFFLDEQMGTNSSRYWPTSGNGLKGSRRL